MYQGKEGYKGLFDCSLRWTLSLFYPIITFTVTSAKSVQEGRSIRFPAVIFLPG